MKTFSYTVRDELGLHAQPAGLLVKEAEKYDSTIIISANGKSIEAGKMMMLMSLGIKQGTKVTVSADGADEERAAEGMKEFFEKSL